MKSTVAIIGVATAGVIGLTLGTVMGPGGTALADPVNAPVNVNSTIHAAAPDAPPPGPDGFGPDRPDNGPGWRRGPDLRPDFRMKLARDLAGLETLAGIRADQLDAWRDYTSALLALMAPPRPPADGDRQPDAFGRSERLADTVIDRAQTAERLKSAIATLRRTLTPEQVALLQQAERQMGPPPRPLPGPGPQDQRFAPPAERPAPHAG
ncbi:hypothetical protein [Inquilinus limosus]|uniref:LTXXQ motif family protein n=1 Tax=Inquilinus limosus TaxID=171674 RepID=A0A211ZHR9_9PROT|nr:hypothetical protein [Inquilinus limosus]OWJ64783.1 hypothetical protein BWR60_23120 [Inquilinus limosus]